MKKIWIYLLFISTTSFAQTKIKTLELSDTINTANIDRAGDLYVITRNSQFQKFDLNGSLVLLMKNDHTPTLFDPRDGSRLFAYYRNNQRYDYMSPSFEI